MNAFFDGHEPGEPPRSLRSSARRGARDPEDAGLWGVSYERAEGLVQLALALTLVGGAAAVLSATVFAPAAPPPGAADASGAVVVAMPREKAAPEQAPPPVAAETPAREAAPAPAPEATSAAPATTLTQTSLLDARPLSGRPLPSAGTGSVADETPAQQPEAQSQPQEEPAPEQEAAAPAAEDQAVVTPPDTPAKETGEGRMAKCFVKVSGRVQMSGACKVAHAGESVRFQLPGKTLEISHKAGRVWVATLGGRSLGQVFKNGACWGARGFYACEKG